MPWIDDIDPGVPQDIEDASEGAERIRELKRGLIQRLSTFFLGFPEDDPHNLGQEQLFPAISVRVGTLAQRPSQPDKPGSGYFATDTGQLFFGSPTLQWVMFSPDVPPPVLEVPIAQVVESEEDFTLIGGGTAFFFDFPEQFTPEEFTILASFFHASDAADPGSGPTQRFYAGRQNFGTGGTNLRHSDGSPFKHGLISVSSIEPRTVFIAGVERFQMRVVVENAATPASNVSVFATLHLVRIGEEEPDYYDEYYY